MNTTIPFNPVEVTADPKESSPRAASLMDDPRRRAILSDREIHHAIRWVVALRGVPSYEVDDVLDTVIEGAMEDARLPLDDREQARMYLVACARNKSIDEARGRQRRRNREVSIDEEPGDDVAMAQDRAILAARLQREGRLRFPRTFSWFWRKTIHGESYVAIAVEHNVSPAHVRHEVYRIRQALQGFSAVVIAFAAWSLLQTWTLPGRTRWDPHHDVASPRPAVVAEEDTPADPAADLRERATARFAEGDWDGVIADLDEARRIDPDGDLAPWKDLYERAEANRRELLAHPEPR
jgi:DNA-directed RNA polymerase specialized sigma24 family protein